MARTTNKYWLYLEELRRSGETNMWAAGTYLERRFNLSTTEASKILCDWIQHYNAEDYADVPGGVSDAAE